MEDKSLFWYVFQWRLGIFLRKEYGTQNVYEFNYFSYSEIWPSVKVGFTIREQNTPHATLDLIP